MAIRNAVFAATGVAMLLIGNVMAADAPGKAAPAEADQALVDRGRYLALAGDCASCHNDPQSRNPFAGGYGVGSPIGMIYGPNITPDEKTGIGGWTLAQFSGAVREGRGGKGKHLYPAMPYTAFSGIADDDIKALYSYFMLGVPAVEHQAPETVLPFPYNMRWLMGIWNGLFGGNGGQPTGQAPQAEGAARGEYLAKALAHCSACHTPRGLLMQEKSGEFMAGGKVGSWTAPNITADPVSGIGNWSADEIFRYLKTGSVPSRGIAAGEMGLAVQNSFSKMSDGDLRSIAAYIKTVPAKSGKQSAPRSGGDRSAPLGAELEQPLDPSDYKAFVAAAGMSGAQIYEGACATCHGHGGRGTPDHILPPLVGSSAVGSVDPSNLVMTIANGVNRTVGQNHVFMPSFAKQLDADQTASVANYVAMSFGGLDPHVMAVDVKRIYSAADGSSWLLAHAGTLVWAALGAFVIVLAGSIYLLRKRRA